jgi:hypothetical protein
MSRDIKYIGMDVHKEATVIAVRNGSGKLVTESIVEIKASSILQFIHWGCNSWNKAIVCSSLSIILISRSEHNCS